MRKQTVIGIVVTFVAAAAAVWGQAGHIDTPSNLKPARPESMKQRPDPRAAQPEEMPKHPADNPGEQHAALARLAGNWTTSSEFAFGGGDPPPPTTGKATLRSVLGGRFVSDENTGEMMGEPMSGFRFLGFNNGTKQYEAAWAYTGSTAILMLTGTSPDSGKTINLSGSYQDPAGDKQTLKVTMTIPDTNQFTIKIEGVGQPAEQTAVLTITYTRAK